jgi:hypothetical protein
VGALDLVADPDAASAQDAAVVVDPVPLVGDVHLVRREDVVEPNVVHSHRDGQVLEFAMTVGHADGADVVALGEEQFQDHPPVVSDPVGVVRILPSHLVCRTGPAGCSRRFRPGRSAGADHRDLERQRANEIRPHGRPETFWSALALTAVHRSWRFYRHDADSRVTKGSSDAIGPLTPPRRRLGSPGTLYPAGIAQRVSTGSSGLPSPHRLVC